MKNTWHEDVSAHDEKLLETEMVHDEDSKAVTVVLSATTG